MGEDEIIRTAVQHATRESHSFEKLQADTKEDLYVALARSIADVASLDPAHTKFHRYETDDLMRNSASLDLGKRIFQRWNRALHEFACTPDKEDEDIRRKLLNAIAGKEGGAAVIAGIMAGTFGVSPVVAAIVAALLLKVIINPALDEVCQLWAKEISDGDK
jgi:hypothetical protein